MKSHILTLAAVFVGLTSSPVNVIGGLRMDSVSVLHSPYALLALCRLPLSPSPAPLTMIPCLFLPLHANLSLASLRYEPLRPSRYALGQSL